jgi:oligoendopeptidase F
MSVEINGQEYTLEQASIFIKDLNREVRENAWKTIQQRRLIDKDDLNILFDELIKLRNQVALNAGFENYRDYMFQALAASTTHRKIAMILQMRLKKKLFRF